MIKVLCGLSLSSSGVCVCVCVCVCVIRNCCHFNQRPEVYFLDLTDRIMGSSNTEWEKSEVRSFSSSAV